MPKRCPHCGVPLIGGMEKATICPRCYYDFTSGKVDENILAAKLSEAENRQSFAQKRKEEEQRRKAEEQQKRDAFICTTTNNISGYSISRYYGVLSGEAVLGTGFFSEFSASFDDAFGVQSSAMGGKLSYVKSAAMAAFIDKCLSVGANAAVGIEMDIMTLSSNMLVASVNGTAVYIEKCSKEGME